MAYKNVVAMAYFVGIRIPDAAAAMLLTEAEGLAGFPLGLERIEGLLQTSSDDVGSWLGGASRRRTVAQTIWSR